MSIKRLLIYFTFVLVYQFYAAPYAMADGKVCLGFDPVSGEWGYERLYPGWIMCPAGYAFFGTRNPFGSFHEAAVEVYGNCCPLPEIDILTDVHVIVDTLCPDGFVVTGFAVLTPDTSRSKDDQRPRQMRCTQVNNTKYALAPAQPGITWGLSAAAAYPWKEQKIIRRDEVPLAIRYGIARRNRDVFLYTGCIGDPPGSLFVGKTGPACKDLLWRTLLKRNPADSGELMPLRMFPDCLKLESVNDVDTPCTTD